MGKLIVTYGEDSNTSSEDEDDDLGVVILKFTIVIYNIITYIDVVIILQFLLFVLK